MSVITFDELSQALASAGCHSGAAECHATLAGLLCSGGGLPRDWPAQITGGGDNPELCREVLETLRLEVQRALQGDQLEFDLLLPADDVELSERTDAMAHWCQGFLFGLTLGGVEADRALPGDVAEVVSDFSRLTEARHEGDAADEDERSYTELCEYVRVGSQLVFEELVASRRQ